MKKTPGTKYAESPKTKDEGVDSRTNSIFGSIATRSLLAASGRFESALPRRGGASPTPVAEASRNLSVSASGHSKHRARCFEWPDRRERRSFGDASATNPSSTPRGIAVADPGEVFGTAPAPVRARGSDVRRFESSRCSETVGARSSRRSMKNAGGFVQESTLPSFVFN